MLKDELLNESHCVFKNYDDIVTLCPIENSVCILNNNEIKVPTKLTQGKINSTSYSLHFRDLLLRIVLGDILVLGTNVFRFNHPRESAKLKEKNVFKTGFLNFFFFVFIYEIYFKDSCNVHWMQFTSLFQKSIVAFDCSIVEHLLRQHPNEQIISTSKQCNFNISFFYLNFFRIFKILFP